MKYYVIGHLYKENKPVCACVAGVDEYGRIWNMRGGLRYMREVEVYPCHIYKSIEALQLDEADLYNDNELFFKKCAVFRVAI